MPLFRRILVPTDFSASADAALQYAQRLAREFHSDLHLLHVVAEPYAYPWGSNEMSTLPMPDYLSQAQDSATERLAKIAGAIGNQRGRVRATTKVGIPVEHILDYAAKHAIDLIVIGAHGGGVVGRVLLGSVAERIVRRSPRPVLTVHEPPARARRKRARATSARAPVRKATTKGA